MQIGSGEHTYVWHDHWAALPETESVQHNGRTHGSAVTRDGHVVVFLQADPGFLVYDKAGQLKASWGNTFSGAHGLTMVAEADGHMFWVTDQVSHEVLKTTLDGAILQSIPAPPIDGNYIPTWVAVNPANGDVWVADGYGSSLVHRYDREGEYQSTLDGEEGAGRFKCPHGIAFSPEGELWIADRGNHRITVYDGEGNYLRSNDDVTHSPCMFAFHDGLVYLPELFACVKIIDQDFNLVANLGDNKPVCDVAGWPNLAGTDHVMPGKFNSPHGLAVDPTSGDIYVCEWIVGGRVTKLEKA